MPAAGNQILEAAGEAVQLPVVAALVLLGTRKTGYSTDLERDLVGSTGRLALLRRLAAKSALHLFEPTVKSRLQCNIQPEFKASTRWHLRVFRSTTPPLARRSFVVLLLLVLVLLAVLVTNSLPTPRAAPIPNPVSIHLPALSITLNRFSSQFHPAVPCFC